ncbi:MAG: LacI family DNA-binding transcriptional regulator [Verrucomicrobiota bacterium]|nr:LacI family DNA-binding transcriptional regulator [Verrucomicrobiota bacterium]
MRIKSAATSVVTLEDIAQKCGLSLATVCYALRGTGTISAKTRQRVESMAAQMGYIPNLNASALAQSRTMAAPQVRTVPVAVFHHDVDEGMVAWKSPDGVMYQYALQMGLSIQVFKIQKSTNLRVLGRMLSARGFKGIILLRFTEPQDFTHFPWEHFAVVFASRTSVDMPFDMVRCSPGNLIRAAFQKTQERGYGRPGVALLQHRVPMIDDTARIGEVLAHNLLHVNEQPVPPFYKCLPTEEEWHDPSGKYQDDYGKSFFHWFSTHQPDVVIGFSVNFYFLLKSNGVSIPETVGYLTLHNPSEGDNSSVISGFQTNESINNRVAIERIHFLITHNRYGIPDSRQEILTTPLWVENQTLPKRGS